MNNLKIKISDCKLKALGPVLIIYGKMKKEGKDSGERGHKSKEINKESPIMVPKVIPIWSLLNLGNLLLFVNVP